MAHDAATLENRQLLKDLNTELPYNQETPVLGKHPREVKTYTHIHIILGYS